MSEKKPSVMTKGQVYQLLQTFGSQIKEFKSVKEVREFVDGFIPQYKPTGRGRRVTSNFDVAALQNLIAEQAEKMTGNDGMYLLGMTASAWNIRSETGATLLDGAKLRKLVESGKLTLPDRFILPERQTRKRKSSSNEEGIN